MAQIWMVFLQTLAKALRLFLSKTKQGATHAGSSNQSRFKWICGHTEIPTHMCQVSQPWVLMQRRHGRSLVPNTLHLDVCQCSTRNKNTLFDIDSYNVMIILIALGTMLKTLTRISTQNGVLYKCYALSISFFQHLGVHTHNNMDWYQSTRSWT